MTLFAMLWVKANEVNFLAVSFASQAKNMSGMQGYSLLGK